MSILITGGAGYIGSHCNKIFKKEGYDTIILDDLSSGHEVSLQGSKLIKGDFSDIKLLGEIFSNYSIDGVVHFAAQKSVEESVSSPNKYYEENVVKTKILIDTMLEYKVNNIVFSSTAAVYGEPDGDVVDESYPTSPINPYGETKLIDEKMMRDYAKAYGLKYCSLRYFNAAGADPDGELGFAAKEEKNVIPLLINATVNNLKGFTVFGDDYDTRDGSCVRDYIHVMDLATAHVKAFEYLVKGNDSEIINLGSNNGYTVLELINVTEEVTGKRLDYKIGPRRAGDPETLIASNKKAKKLLGWAPAFSDIKEIIGDSYRWASNRKY